jgi:hypothetical protein
MLSDNGERMTVHKRVKAFYLKDNTWWNTDHWLAKVILAALDQFIVNHAGYPWQFTDAEWEAELQKMKAAFTILADNEGPALPTKEEQAVVDEGLASFAKNYQGLWD